MKHNLLILSDRMAKSILIVALFLIVSISVWADSALNLATSKSRSPIEFITELDNPWSCINHDRVYFFPGSRHSKILVTFTNLCFEEKRIFIELNLFTTAERTIIKRIPLAINGLETKDFIYQFAEDLLENESGSSISIVWQLEENTDSFVTSFFSPNDFQSHPMILGLQGNGFPIYKGNQVSNMMGKYRCSGLGIKKQTSDWGLVNETYSKPFAFNILHQGDDRSIQYSLDLPVIQELGTPEQAFITGKDSYFTLYQTYVSNKPGCLNQSLLVLSGMLVKNGNLEDVQIAISIINQHGSCLQKFQDQSSIIFTGDFVVEKPVDENSTSGNAVSVLPPVATNPATISH